jgi:hypothetical protein
LTLLLVTGVIALCHGQEGAGARRKNTTAAGPKAADDIFTRGSFLRIKIEIPPDGMGKLRAGGGGWGRTQEGRVVVKASVIEDGRVYTNVALHLKGAAGSYRPIDDQPAFTLSFDKFTKGQEFHGLDKISLNNSVQDPSFLSEKICREIFNAAGVPAPGATHAIVELNGNNLGVYVLVEGWGKRFLKRHFKNPRGNLYDGGFVREITDGLDVNSGDNPKDRSAIQRLADAANEPDPKQRMARLEKTLDVERFITLLALDVLMCNWDGYAMNRNNYRLFHDMEHDRMVFMPHGLDQMFESERIRPADSLLPHMEGLVARQVIQTAEGRRRFMAKVSSLTTNVFVVHGITNRVREVAAQIRPAFAERGEQSARHFDRVTKDLCMRIAERCASIEHQIASPADPLAFDASGIAKLKGWTSKQDWEKAAVAEIKDGDGKPLLHINVNTNSATGTWRTRVLLEGGQYRFEGRVKTKGVVPDPGDKRGGAKLRVSGRQVAPKLTGDADWTTLSFDFEISEGMGEAELICELRSRKGEAWFDAESLRLIRK